MDLLVDLFKAGLEWELAKEVRPGRSSFVGCAHPKMMKLEFVSTEFNYEDCVEFVIAEPIEFVNLKQVNISSRFYWVGKCSMCGQIYYTEKEQNENSNVHRGGDISIPHNKKSE